MYLDRQSQNVVKGMLYKNGGKTGRVLGKRGFSIKIKKNAPAGSPN